MNKFVDLDRLVIMDWVGDGASVLDLGCGDGTLLQALLESKHARVQGIEISDQAVHSCVAAGLNVFQQDIDKGLAEYADRSFDFVVLNQTFQQVKKPDYVLREGMRVGRKVIVGFPNFCYFASRVQIFFRGKVPVTASLPYQWFDTPNLHFLSFADFKEYCQNREITIEQSYFWAKNKRVVFMPNLRAEIGLFLLSK